MNWPRMILTACVFALPCCGWRIPEDYQGPYARIKVSAVPDGKRTMYFTLTDVNGRGRPWLQDESLTSNRAPDGDPVRGGEWVIPAGEPIRIRIKGVHAYTAGGSVSDGLGEFAVFTLVPEIIYDVVDAGLTPRYREVEGDVTFTPRAGGRYVITGRLGPHHSSAWIEELGTGRLVGRKVAM